MGFYYTSFINELKNEYSKSKMSLKEFMESEKINQIYDEYEVGAGNLHWAVNIDKFFSEIGESVPEIQEKCDMLLEANSKDWEDNGFPY